LYVDTHGRFQRAVSKERIADDTCREDEGYLIASSADAYGGRDREANLQMTASGGQSLQLHKGKQVAWFRMIT
jgi:hypothetical protein